MTRSYRTSGMSKRTHAALLYIINLDEHKKVKAELENRQDEIELLRRKAELYDEISAIVEESYRTDDEGNLVGEDDLGILGERIASKFGYL